MKRTPERLAQLLGSINGAVVGDHVAGVCREASDLIRSTYAGLGSRVFDRLRTANLARQAEWDPTGAKMSLTYRGNELGGEVGEALERAIDIILLAVRSGQAANLVKKIERERLGLPGSRATLAQLAEELADVIICVDLIAIDTGVDLVAALEAKFNATSEKVGLATRLDLSLPGRSLDIAGAVAAIGQANGDAATITAIVGRIATEVRS